MSYKYSTDAEQLFIKCSDIAYTDNNSVCWILKVSEREGYAAITEVELGTDSTIKIKIAPGAFSDLPNLASVKLGPNVLFVGDGAFANCPKLQSFTLAAQLDAALLNTNNQEELVIKPGILTGCTALTSLTIPFLGDARKADKTTTFLGYLFDALCADKQAESIPESLRTITLTGTTIIRHESLDGVQTNVPYIDFTLYKNSFRNCCYIENVYLPKRSWNERNPDSKLTTIDIPDDCFNNCSSLKLLTVIPSYLEATDTPIFDNTLDISSFAGSSSHIGERAFYGCMAIYNVILPEQYPDLTKKGLPRIGVDAFTNCYNLVGVYGPGVALLQQGIAGSTLNGDVTHYAVAVSPTIPASNENINSMLSLLNNGWYIEEDSNNAVIFDCVAGQSELTISKYRDSMNKEFDTKIKDYSFNNNQTIKKITIAEGITELGDYAFRNCSELEEIILPKTLTALGAYTFVGCPKLKTIKYRGTFNDWCKINFGAFHQLFANADSVYFNDGNASTAADSFDLPLFYKAENILSPEEIPIESDINEINSFAFYKFTCNRTFKFTSAQLKIGNYAFANCPNLTVELATGADISTLGYNAFENSTKSFIKNTNTYNNVIMLSNYTLGSWLMAVEIPQSYKNNMSDLATIYNYQFGCSIPKNITNIKEDVYKQANAELSALQAELSRTAAEVGVSAPQIIFRTHYSSNIKDWASINFANSWSNPLYQEYGALGTDKLLMKFYLETFDNEGDPVLTECTEADLSSQVDPYDPTHLIETKINNFAFCGFTFDELSLLDTTILGDKAFEGAKIGTAKVTPNNCIYVANPTLTTLEIYSSRFTSNSIISNAFSGSSNLTTIAISGNNLKFGANAFLDCKNLTTVKYNNTLENWCKLTFDNKYANPLYNLSVSHFIVNGTEITETINLENVDALRSFTFCNLTSLHTINFVNCANISFDSQWILNCPTLKSLNLQGTIPSGQYTISNNSIFKVNDDYKTLIMTTNGTDFTALTDIQEIATGAISCLANNDSTPLEIVLPDSVRIIQPGAIDRNLGVSRLVIPFLGRSVAEAMPEPEPEPESEPELVPDEEASTETTIGNDRGEEYLYTKYLGYIFGATTYKENSDYVPSQLKEVCITKDTKFEDFAFFGCKYLEAVFTSHELSFIADNAFDGCIGLTNSYLYSVDYYRMSELDRLANETTSRTALYKATTSIFASTNEDLAQLTDFTLSVNYPIYSNAFSANCLIDYPNIKVTVELTGDKDISIGKAAFRNFKNLVAVKNSVAGPFTGTAHIGAQAFAGCTNLAQVFLPDKLSYLGTEAFMNCIAITDLIVPTVVVTLRDEGKLGTNLLLNCNALTNIEMPTMLTPYITKSNLVTVTFNQGTEINAAAFRDCKLLRSVATKGTSITAIGAQAFKGCIQLRTINLSSIESLGKEAFMNCINLRNITSIPFNTLKKLYDQEMSTESFIASNVFLNCVKLVELKITTGSATPAAIAEFEEVVFGSTKVDADGNELVTVGRKDAFGGCCSNLQQTELGYDDAFASKITTTGNWSIFKENICLDYDNPASLVTHLKLPNTITSIYKYAFIANDVIEQLEIPAKLESIDAYAFYSCNNFKELTYNTADTSDFALSTIGVGAFMNTGVVDTSKIFLTKFTKISAILSETFSSCANLTTIMIPKNILTVDTFAFKNCPIIETIEVAVGHTTYGNTKLNTLIKKLPAEPALSGAPDTFAVQLGCKNSSFPLDLNITEIQENAFSGCTGLIAVALPSSLVSIGKEAFAGCSALAEIQFECPELITIGNCAFKGCSSLESVDLSTCSKLTTIKTEAFMGCSNLSVVTLPNKISEIYAKAFASCKLQQIHIPRTVENKGTENEKVTGINTMGDFVFMQNPASLIIYCNELPASFLTDASSPTILNSWKVDWNRLSLNTTQTYIVK